MRNYEIKTDMKLTDKTEKEFFEWLDKQTFYIHEFVPTSKNWDTIPDSMKWGVYVDFFMTKGITFKPESFWRGIWCHNIEIHSAIKLIGIVSDSKNQNINNARSHAIEMANEIYNNS